MIGQDRRQQRRRSRKPRALRPCPRSIAGTIGAPASPAFKTSSTSTSARRRPPPRNWSSATSSTPTNWAATSPRPESRQSTDTRSLTLAAPAQTPGHSQPPQEAPQRHQCLRRQPHDVAFSAPGRQKRPYHLRRQRHRPKMPGIHPPAQMRHQRQLAAPSRSACTPAGPAPPQTPARTAAAARSPGHAKDHPRPLSSPAPGEASVGQQGRIMPTFPAPSRPPPAAPAARSA